MRRFSTGERRRCFWICCASWLDVEQAGDVVQHLRGLYAPVRGDLQLRGRRVVRDGDRARTDLPHVAVVLDALELRDQPVREIVEQVTPGKWRADRQRDRRA